MKKRIVIATFLVTAVGALAAAPLVLADRPHGRLGHHRFGHGFGPLGRLAHIKGELDLTDQQVDQIKAILRETREQSAPYREQLHGGYMGVVQALLEDPNDVAAAQRLVDQQLNAERALKANLLNATSRAVAVLNDEQRAKLSTIIEEHERHGWRRGR